jgi:hypothetical protein
MKIKEGKVKVDEIDLGFCLIHILYIIFPCGYTNILGVYKMGKKDNRMDKMTILGTKEVLALPHLFIYYEQNMAKFVFLFDYNNNVY